MTLRLFSALSIGLLLAGADAPAQTPTRFEGRVIEESSDKPVAGATVSIVGVTGIARTDQDGRFHWAPAPVRRQIVCVGLADCSCVPRISSILSFSSRVLSSRLRTTAATIIAPM